jgi:hypothetical protein
VVGERHHRAIDDGGRILAQCGLKGDGETGRLAAAPDFSEDARMFLDIRR